MEIIGADGLVMALGLLVLTFVILTLLLKMMPVNTSRLGLEAK